MQLLVRMELSIFAMITTQKNASLLCQSKVERAINAEKLRQIGADILTKVPGSALASDQPFRVTDFAIDFAEDVDPLPINEIKKNC